MVETGRSCLGLVDEYCDNRGGHGRGDGPDYLFRNRAHPSPKKNTRLTNASINHTKSRTDVKIRPNASY